MIKEMDIKKIVETLNEATKSYDEGHPIMTDEEWDNLYFQLCDLEKESGIYLPDSPTQQITYNIVSKLEKVKHNHPMLSLAKTKDIEEVKKFYDDKDILAMCKMDGLTCSLRYLNGKLVSAETRGNGIIGENVLHNALVISSIPKKIKYKQELIIDGEIICKYNDFEQFSSNFKNPRNFAAGSINLLDSAECAKRHLTFIAWDVIKGYDSLDDLMDKLIQLPSEGFEIVPLDKGPPDKVIESLKLTAQIYEYPIDGIVFKYNNCDYYKSLGATEHHFRGGLAYKFYDETYETILKDIDWTMGRTGILTPVAVFEPIDIDGSVIERANLHNLSIMNELWPHQWHSGLSLEVYKANQIIPQIATVSFKESSCAKNLNPPLVCPCCGEPTSIIDTDNSKVLMCQNSHCQGKLLNKLIYFCGKKGLDIKGLSEATLDKFINWGWINSIKDIFELKKFASELKQKEGFGEKSVNNLFTAIEEAKNVKLSSFISAIGIPNIGLSFAKELTKHISSYEEFREKVNNHFDFSVYDGIADTKTSYIWHFNYSDADEIYPYLNIQPEEQIENTLNGMNICITGHLNIFKNRDALIAAIVAKGGKVVSSISSKTFCLINNDIESTSTKNKAAKNQGIKIITEEEFKHLYLD